MSVAQLIATVVTTPDLPGAACVDHLDVFDACINRGATFAYDQAVQICASQCPAGAAALLISVAEAVCALAAAGVRHDRLGGCGL
jgi:hypothetical protein